VKHLKSHEDGTLDEEQSTTTSCSTHCEDSTSFSVPPPEVEVDEPSWHCDEEDDSVVDDSCGYLEQPSVEEHVDNDLVLPNGFSIVSDSSGE
jgi:hypothetical protein